MTSYTHSSRLELLEVLRTTSLFALRAVERLTDHIASGKLLPLNIDDHLSNAVGLQE